MQEKSTPGKFRELSSTHLGPLTRFYFPPAHFPPMSLHTPLSHQRLRKGKKTSLPMGNTPVLGTATADLVPPSPCLNTVRRKAISHRLRLSSIIRRAPVASKQLEGVRAAPGPDCHPRLGLPLPGGENTGMAHRSWPEALLGRCGWSRASTPGCLRAPPPQNPPGVTAESAGSRSGFPGPGWCCLSCCSARSSLAAWKGTSSQDLSNVCILVVFCSFFAEISSHALKYRAFKSFPVLLGSAARVS